MMLVFTGLKSDLDAADLEALLPLDEHFQSVTLGTLKVLEKDSLDSLGVTSIFLNTNILLGTL